MYTLVDFITHVKGIEYILCILSIAGFLVLWEVLKPAPFGTVAAAGRDDLAHIRGGGARNALRTAGRLAAAPVIGLAYLAMLPVGFAAAVVMGAAALLLKGAGALTGALGMNISFGWRPMEAYFTGRRGQKGAENGKN